MKSSIEEDVKYCPCGCPAWDDEDGRCWACIATSNMFGTAKRSQADVRLTRRGTIKKPRRKKRIK